MKPGWLALLALGALHAESLNGTVVDTAGAPVAGALVAAAERSPWAAERLPLTRSDAGGRFTLELPDFFLGQATRLLALTESPRRVGAYCGRPAPTATVVLRPVRACSGQLVDPARRPLAGVAVRVESVLCGATDSALWPPPPWPEWGTTTDARGRWSLLAAPVGGELTLSADDGQHQPARWGTDDYDGPTVLGYGATVRGRVSTAAGQPVAGLRLGALPEWGRAALRLTRTDVAGRFTLAGLPPGKCRVLQRDPTAAVAAAPSAVLSLRPGCTRDDVDLVAQPSLALTVRVVSADDRRPLPDIAVAVEGVPLWDGPSPDYPAPRTDAHGEVRLRVGPGELGVSVGGQGLWGATAESFARPVLAAGQAPTPVTLTLARRRLIEGVVRDTAGVPLTDAEVRTENTAITRTDAAGHFRLGPLLPGADYPVSVTEPSGYRRHEARHTLSAVPAQTWTLVVPACARCTVRGRVVDQAGQPVDGATVTLWVPHTSPHAASLWRWRDTPPRTVTDEGGGYRLPDLPALAGYQATAACRGYRARAAVAVGADFGAPDLVLDALRGRVAGRVVDPRGQPLAGAVVRVLGLADREARTAADGRFELTGLPERGWRVLALAGRDAVDVVSAAPGGGELTLRPQPTPARTAHDDRALAIRLLTQAWHLVHLPPLDPEPRLATYDPEPRVMGLLAQVAPAAALALIKAEPPPGGLYDDAWQHLLNALARSDPALCLATLDWLAGQPGANPGETFQLSAAQQVAVGLRLAGREPAAARRLYEQSATAAAQADSRSPCRLERCALAACLARPEAARLATELCGEPLVGGWEDPGRTLLACYRWARWPALLRAAEPHLVTANPDEDQRYDGALLSVLGLVRAGDVTGAQARLAAVATPALRAWASGEGADHWALALTLQRLTEALAPTQPAAAWRVVTGLGDSPPVEALQTLAALSPDRDLARRAAELAYGLAPSNPYAPPPLERVQALANPNAARLACERRLASAPEEDEPYELDVAALLDAARVDPRLAAEAAATRGRPTQRPGHLRCVAQLLLVDPRLRWVPDRAVRYHNDIAEAGRAATMLELDDLDDDLDGR